MPSHQFTMMLFVLPPAPSTIFGTDALRRNDSDNISNIETHNLRNSNCTSLNTTTVCCKQMQSLFGSVLLLLFFPFVFHSSFDIGKRDFTSASFRHRYSVLTIIFCNTTVAPLCELLRDIDADIDPVLYNPPIIDQSIGL
jgi:hypothetical protein